VKRVTPSGSCVPPWLHAKWLALLGQSFVGAVNPAGFALNEVGLFRWRQRCSESGARGTGCIARPVMGLDLARYVGQKTPAASHRVAG
jgi:hypothetical protein